MKSSAGKIRLAGFDDLFGTGGEAEAGGERVQEIPLSELHPFKDHPFKVKDDDEMERMAESIAEHGVLVPGIVRPRKEGGYEIIAGHRRKRGCELAGIPAMRAIVLDLDDDEATIIMVDSNLQREKILPSEKAFAYRMKVAALNHMGARPDRTLAPAVPRLRAREQVALDAGEGSRMAVTRYIALTRLIPPLLALVDEGKLSLSNAADYISGLTEQEQVDLASAMDRLDVVPGRGQLAEMKQRSKDGGLTADAIESILSTERPAPVQVVLKQSKLRRFFPQGYTARQMEEVIVSLLEAWSARQE